MWVDMLRDCVCTNFVCEPDSDCELLETPRACDPPYVLNTPLRRKECGKSHNAHSAFVGVTSQVTDLIDQVNATSGCKATSGCTGELKLVRVRLAGLGCGNDLQVPQYLLLACQFIYFYQPCGPHRVQFFKKWPQVFDFLATLVYFPPPPPPIKKKIFFLYRGLG